MFYVPATIEPAILQRARQRLGINGEADTKRARKEKEKRARYAINARAYARVSFHRHSFELAHFFGGRRARGTFDGPTLNDEQNRMSENCDFSYIYGREYARDIWREHGDDARDIFRHLTRGDAPVSRYVDTLQSDTLRSYAQAMEDDYSCQYFDFLRDAIERAADAIACDGIAWAWLDASGKPTSEDYDAHAIGFALSRRAYLNPRADWWPRKTWKGKDCTETTWHDYTSNRARLDDADSVMSEYYESALSDNLTDTSDFDERGGRYADPEWWPLLLVDYCEAVDEFERERDKMRARLADMIRNRAPLETRAAHVAAFYGTPGTNDETEED
jgi:hypothetical protein